jgi:hypothetical protein
VVSVAGLHGDAIEALPPGTFPDVPFSEEPYPFDYVEEAASAGIVQGFADGSFHPYEAMKRLQLVRMVGRAAAAAGSPLPAYSGPAIFADVLPSAPWYDEVMRAYAAGIMSGRADGGLTFLDPWQQASRGHVAKMTANLVAFLDG